MVFRDGHANICLLRNWKSQRWRGRPQLQLAHSYHWILNFWTVADHVATAGVAHLGMRDFALLAADYASMVESRRCTKEQ